MVAKVFRRQKNCHLFEEGSLDPDDYDLKGLWESDEVFKQYNIRRFWTNFARIAKHYSISNSIASQCESIFFPPFSYAFTPLILL